MEEEALIYNIKVSSIGPGYVTSPDLIVEPGNMDLAMKLHYLRGVYYFEMQAFQGLTTLAIKEPMFMWLNQHPMSCGRFRRSESGRPYIKCNDCGVRFIEANCVHTLDDWLQIIKDGTTLQHETLLCSNQCIGPELSFSPLIYIQLTKFKCGGAAVGLSWAHVLGDAFSAAEYMNSLGRVVAGLGPERPINLGHTPTKPTSSNGMPGITEEPLSIKRVDPVGDNWVNVTKSKMEAFCCIVNPTQLSHLQTKLNANGADFAPFEAISAVIWKCIAKIRVQELEPRVVTICKRSEPNTNYGSNLRNSQAVSVVKADFPISEANPSELAALVKNEALDEGRMIEEAMERDHGLADFIVYGANLTFVNLEDARFYDFDYRGGKPVSVSYRIDGVGEKGAVLVQTGGGENGGGRSVTAILPVNEIIGFKSELKKEGLMA
ncbi:protein eceriferum 26 [Phtheirospermum japonicum]|uniref:Protein eceriferum 26 n=1 Tax=Phtheirospermum japonicum TaxID=374723 RepID=A0A830B4X7_9LAMI|nr:protein eceriferum 26 [Phtheirospermum japonicum]